MEPGSGLRLCGRVLFGSCAHAREALTPGVSDSHVAQFSPPPPDRLLSLPLLPPYRGGA